MVDLWLIIACISLVIGYSITGFYLYNILKQHIGDNTEYAQQRNDIKHILKMFGLFPLAYILQWLAYGLFKLYIIPRTYEMTLWVVLTGNSGGIFNLLLYYPLLRSKVNKTKKRAYSNSGNPKEADDDKNQIDTKKNGKTKVQETKPITPDPTPATCNTFPFTMSSGLRCVHETSLCCNNK